MANVLPFAPRGSASRIPPYDHRNPTHRAAWEGVWRLGMAELDRDARESLSATIDLLDIIDGDPDLEPNGDELDGNASEDDWMHHGHHGPGCPISDPDCSVDDTPCDDLAIKS